MLGRSTAAGKQLSSMPNTFRSPGALVRCRRNRREENHSESLSIPKTPGASLSALDMQKTDLKLLQWYQRRCAGLGWHRGTAERRSAPRQQDAAGMAEPPDLRAWSGGPHGHHRRVRHRVQRRQHPERRLRARRVWHRTGREVECHRGVGSHHGLRDAGFPEAEEPRPEPLRSRGRMCATK